MRVNHLKLGAFAAIMVLLTGFLFVIFGQYDGGATRQFTALFTDASRLASGDSVRAAGIRVGTVTDVKLLPDDPDAAAKVLVTFDADRAVPLTTGTTAAVRYLNLVGDRYLELVDTPGSTRLLSPGSQIPVDRTAPALDLDLLLGGLKPVIQGLNPQDVNALTSSLIQIFQGQGDTLSSLFSTTSSFTNALADNSSVVEQLIDNLDLVVATVNEKGDEFSGTVDRLQALISGLSDDRDPIATAIDSLDDGTASLTELLGNTRPPLKDTVDELARLAPLVAADKDVLDNGLQRAPENYRKLVRLGAYGAFVNYYTCGISFRATDLQGRTAVFPWVKQETGRCAER